MWFFVIFALGYCQDCPSVFYLGNLYNQANLFVYSSGYKQIITSVQNAIVYLQAESGTLRSIKLTDGQSVTYLETESSNIFVGQNNELLVYSLDEDNPVKASLNFVGSVQSTYTMNSLIGVGTNQNEVILWDYQSNSVLGKAKSLVLQNILINYQILVNQAYDTMIAGTTAGGQTYLEYYTQNMQFLLKSFAIDQFTLYQISTKTVSDTEFTINLYTVFAQTLTINLVDKKSSTITLTSQQINLQLTPIQMYLVEDYIIFFSSTCQYQKYDIKQNSVGNLNSWTSTCPNNIKQLQFSIEDQLIILLLNNPQDRNEMIQIYQLDTNLIGTQIRSFYYLSDSISQSFILQSKYIIEVGQTSSDIYIYNQWYQLQQIITVNNNNNYAIQIIQQDLILILYQNGLVVALSQTSQTCQFTQYQCYSYSIQSQFQFSTVASYTTQLVSQFQYNNIIYVIYALNNNIYCYSFLNSAFSLTPTNQQTLTSNVLQIITSTNSIYLLLSDNTLYSCQFSVATTNTNLQIYYQYTISNVNFVTQNSQVQIATNGQQIVIIQISNQQVKQISNIGVSFKQIQIYSDLLILLEQNSYRLSLFSISNLLNDYNTASFILDTQYFSELFVLNQNFLLIQLQYSVMSIQITDYFQSGNSQCDFTQVYSSNSQNYINTQISLTNFYILYQTIQQLEDLNGFVQINKQNVIWNRIIIDQSINNLVSLQIKGSSPTQSSLIIAQEIKNFQQIFLQDLTLILPQQILILSKMIAATVQNCQLVFNNNFYYNFQLKQITNFQLFTISMSNQDMAKPFIQASSVDTIQLKDIQITQSKLQQLVQIDTATFLYIKNLQVQDCECIQQPQYKQLFQYFSLTIQTAQFIGNQLCSSLFNNIIIDNNGFSHLQVNDLTIKNNNIQQYVGAAIINYVQSSVFQQSNVYLSFVTLQNNQYQQQDQIYAFQFQNGGAFQGQNMLFDNSSILISSFKLLQISNFTFSNPSQLSINIAEIPQITISLIIFNTGSVYQDGFIQIINEKDYVCSNSQCQIQISKVVMNQITLISQSLANTCYGLNIQLRSQFYVQLSEFNFTNLNLQAADSNFIVSSTALFFQGFQSQLLIQSSNFQQIQYSLSTSVLILNAQSIILNSITVNQINFLGSVYYGTQSEKGGFAQISCASFSVEISKFSYISSYSGSIFIIQMYHADGIDPSLQFVGNTISYIYSFGYGAIYIENAVDQTTITFKQNSFLEICSLKDGGLLFVQKEQQISYPQLNITQLSLINIDDVLPYQFNRTIYFSSNTFSNLYSSNGSIIIASLYNITFKDNYFNSNNITATPQKFNSIQITQGSLFYLEYCVLILQNFTITQFKTFANQKNEGELIYSFKSWIQLNYCTFSDIIVKNSNLFYINLSYLKSDTLILQNIVQNQSSTDKSLVEIYDSAVYMLFAQFQLLQCLNYKCVSSGFYIKTSYSYMIGGSCIDSRGNYGGCFYLTLKQQWAVFDSLIFDHNYVNSSGGTILADLQNNNIAADSGGCVYINSFNQSFDINQVQDNPVVYINQSQFINNVAQKYGGALKTLVFNPLIDKLTTFINNSAFIEGDNISSYPSALFLTSPLDPEMPNNYVYDESLEPVQGYYFIPYSNNGQYFLKYFKSGDTVQYPLRFILKSSNNQTMYDDQAYLKIYPSGSENYSLSISDPSRGNNEVRFKEGFFTLQNLTAIGIPETEYPFYITTDQIKSLSKYKYYYVSNYNYTFFVVFRKCLYGEIWQSFDNYTVCYQCPQGFYSFDLPTPEDKGQCQVCPLVSKYRIQCFGGAQTNLEPVYWRENITTLQIYKCDPEFSDCVGGITQDQCGDGYTGRMCQACDYQNNYARDSRSICILCSQVDWPIAIILLSSVGIFLYFTMSIFFLAQDVVILCVLPCLNQMLPPLKKIGSNLGQVKDLNSLLKIFLAYYQKISLVSKIVVDIPSQVQDTSDSSIFDFSLECPMINVNDYVPMVYVNYIIEVLKPISSMVIFMFIWWILFRNQKIKRGIYYTATWLIIWLFYLPSFYEKTLQLLNCKSIGDGRYLKPDLNQDCYGTEHFFYTLFISIPCLLFFVVYIPAMLLYNIRNDMRKKDKRPLRKYKYYYINGEFTEKYYYWEFVRLLEKILIQTAIEIFFYDTTYMAESCLIIVLMYGIASFATQPYGYKRQNFVNVISSFTAFGTIYIALVIATLKNQNTDPNAPIIIFFEILLAIINVIYALWMAWKLFIVLLPVLFVNIEQIQRKVANIRCLRKLALNERLRAKLLFKQIGQKIIVINLIKKHAMIRYLKKEQKDQQLVQIKQKANCCIGCIKIYPQEQSRIFIKIKWKQLRI
ncbi:unnamed protein product (macronuclear) [Paramecium tetraurelia]|uniref:Transmembrane protein n=1 Tax=Paramecium tetraurelia TaxID=5888 RepID=A0CUB9_PARTE|nr:uncharacterized protein GSPATT00010586001 [Paramecium tetraurelia]CAK74386.1 unnamed protein product [Paramecium tetraurelia]|eukprot:XP_001441783.1 hypothetical protein (macronuclear) [Paramecium tetraurelia strain d4-2]